MSKPKYAVAPHFGAALAELVSLHGRRLRLGLAERRNRQSGIHAARRACRRLRVLLGLMPHDHPGLKPLDAGLRELARQLAPLRDAHVAIQTAQQLDGSHAVSADQLIQLQLHSDTLLHEALSADEDFRLLRRRARELTKAIERLPWHTLSIDEARRVVTRMRHRCRKARRKALHHADAERLHRWRRRARNLRYGMLLVRKARRMAALSKHGTGGYRRRSKRLGQVVARLGLQQDITVLQQILRQLPPGA